MSIFSKVLKIGEGKRLRELETVVDCVNRIGDHEAVHQRLADAARRAARAD